MAPAMYSREQITFPLMHSCLPNDIKVESKFKTVLQALAIVNNAVLCKHGATLTSGDCQDNTESDQSELENNTDVKEFSLKVQCENIIKNEQSTLEYCAQDSAEDVNNHGKSESSDSNENNNDTEGAYY